MKLSILFLLLLGSVMFWSCSSNGQSKKNDKEEVIKLDSSNKKSISKDDSSGKNLAELSIDLDSLNREFISKVDSTRQDYLDLLLSCGKYSYFPNGDRLLRSYFSVPYNGCVFNPKYHPNNKLGWANIIIIPKHEYEMDFSDINENQKIDLIEGVVNNMSQKELKLKFDLIIFLIEKKYLHYVENAEINYYPKLPYVKKAFVYKKDLKKWTLVYSVKIEDESEESKWTDKVIAELSK